MIRRFLFIAFVQAFTLSLSSLMLGIFDDFHIGFPKDMRDKVDEITDMYMMEIGDFNTGSTLPEGFTVFNEAIESSIVSGALNSDFWETRITTDRNSYNTSPGDKESESPL